MSGTGAAPCSDATSRRRDRGVGVRPATAIATPSAATATATATQTEAGREAAHDQNILLSTRIEPAGLEVVLHQAAAEVADPQLADRRRQDDVLVADVARPGDAGQHHHLAVAVDVDLARAFEHEVAVRQHLHDAGRDRRRQRAAARRAPLPLNCVLATTRRRGWSDRSPTAAPSRRRTSGSRRAARLLESLSSAESAVPAPSMFSTTRMVTRSLTRARAAVEAQVRDPVDRRAGGRRRRRAPRRLQVARVEDVVDVARRRRGRCARLLVGGLSAACRRRRRSARAARTQATARLTRSAFIMG